ncbi:hypothetical protein D3C72_2147030 [compost metagenome]
MNYLFTGILAGAIDIQRSRLIRFHPCCSTAAIKDIVGGKMHQQGATGPCLSCQSSYGFTIDTICELRLGLCLIDSRICRAIDDHIRLIAV